MATKNDISVKNLRASLLVLDTASKNLSKAVRVAMVQALHLPSDEVFTVFKEYKARNSFSKTAIVMIKKVYGLRFVTNVDETEYQGVMMDILGNESVCNQALVDVLWGLTSFQKGDKACMNANLNSRTKMTKNKPTQLNIELYKAKYPAIPDNYYTGICDAFKLNIADMTKKDEEKLRKLVDASVKVERKELTAKEKALQDELDAVEAMKDKLSKEKQALTDKALKKANTKAEKDLIKLQAEVEERKKIQSEMNEKLAALSAEKDIWEDEQAKAVKKATEKAEKEAKKKFQSKEAKEVEKLQAKLQALENAKETMKGASNPEIEARLEKALADKERTEARNAKLEQEALEKDSRNARQTTIIRKLENSVAQDPDLIIALITEQANELKGWLENQRMTKGQKSHLVKHSKKIVDIVHALHTRHEG